MNVNTLCCSLKHLFSHGFVQWDEALYSRFRCRVNVITSEHCLYISHCAKQREVSVNSAVLQRNFTSG